VLNPADLSALLIKLDDYLNSEEVQSLPLDEALSQLVALNDAKKELASVYDSYAAKMTHRMQSENSTIITLRSGEEIKCMTGAPRKKWDNENLMSAVYDRIHQSSVDMDTGEVGLSGKEIVIKLLDYLSPSYWRVKALNDIGINADMYCETGESKTNVAIYGSKKGDK
jgi:hypothetical protein